MKLSDFKNIFKTREVEIIKVENVTDDKYTVDFKIDDLSWTPGEHAIFSINNKGIKGKKWRAFSISSIPQDGVISIATKIGDNPSSYKNVLKDMQPGEKIKMRGPFGWYKIQKGEKNAVIIASGVGITPAMAILKENTRLQNNKIIHLLYHSKNSFLYKKEIDDIDSTNENINVSYIDNSEEFNIAIHNTAKENGSLANYYISGAPQMIKKVSENIKAKEISKKRLISDPFMGY